MATNPRISINELDELTQQFDEWRKQRKYLRERFPAELMQRALELAQKLPVEQVAEALKLEERRLRERLAEPREKTRPRNKKDPPATKTKASPPRVVKLAPVVFPDSMQISSAPSGIEIHSPSGWRLTVAGGDWVAILRALAEVSR